MTALEQAPVKKRRREQVGHQPPSPRTKAPDNQESSSGDRPGRHRPETIINNGGTPLYMMPDDDQHGDLRPERDLSQTTLDFSTRIHSRTRHRVIPSSETIPAESLPEENNDIDRSTIRRRRRALALSVTAIAAGIAVAAGGISVLPMLHDRGGTQQPASDKKNLDLIVPNPTTSKNPNTPPENSNSKNNPTTIIITDQGIITPQDGNQWNSAAKKTLDALGHPSIPVTNIVAKMGAYESRSTSPDPDAAKAGDSFTTLNPSAIKLVDQLQQPPSNTSQAEIDAAAIIHKLNNLNPMETQALIAQYSSELESLKNDITAILAPQTDINPSHSLQKLAGAVQVPVVEKQSTPERATKATIIFSRLVEKAGSIMRRDSVTDGKKAIAALSADRKRRQLALAV